MLHNLVEGYECSMLINGTWPPFWLSQPRRTKMLHCASTNVAPDRRTHIGSLSACAPGAQCNTLRSEVDYDGDYEDYATSNSSVFASKFGEEDDDSVDELEDGECDDEDEVTLESDTMRLYKSAVSEKTITSTLNKDHREIVSETKSNNSIESTMSVNDESVTENDVPVQSKAFCSDSFAFSPCAFYRSPLLCNKSIAITPNNAHVTESPKNLDMSPQFRAAYMDLLRGNAGTPFRNWSGDFTPSNIVPVVPRMSTPAPASSSSDFSPSSDVVKSPDIVPSSGAPSSSQKCPNVSLPCHDHRASGEIVKHVSTRDKRLSLKRVVQRVLFG